MLETYPPQIVDVYQYIVLPLMMDVLIQPKFFKIFQSQPQIVLFASMLIIARGDLLTNQVIRNTTTNKITHVRRIALTELRDTCAVASIVIVLINNRDNITTLLGRNIITNNKIEALTFIAGLSL